MAAWPQGAFAALVGRRVGGIAVPLREYVRCAATGARPDGGGIVADTRLPGRSIANRYRLVEELGGGGFGRVWRARDEALDAEVALKQVWLPPAASAAERAERLSRAQREGRHAVRLRDHPNIVTVYDVVTDDEAPWLVMRLVEGVSLRQRLETRGRLTEPQVVHLAQGLLAALTAAHAAGVVHRDVKPANVLLSTAGEVLLTDFGIAVHAADATLTAPGMVVGSAAYTAPERLLGAVDGAPGDLFSLGATLYEAATGAGPFHRELPAAAIHAVLNVEPDPPAVSAPLQRLITGLLAKDPAQRPTGAAAAELVAGLTARPVPVSPPAAPGTTLPRTKPLPPAAAGGAEGGPVGAGEQPAGGLAGTPGSGDRSTNPAKPAGSGTPAAGTPGGAAEPSGSDGPGGGNPDGLEQSGGPVTSDAAGESSGGKRGGPEKSGRAGKPGGGKRGGPEKSSVGKPGVGKAGGSAKSGGPAKSGGSGKSGGAAKSHGAAKDGAGGKAGGGGKKGGPKKPGAAGPARPVPPAPDSPSGPEPADRKPGDADSPTPNGSGSSGWKIVVALVVAGLLGWHFYLTNAREAKVGECVWVDRADSAGESDHWYRQPCTLAVPWSTNYLVLQRANPLLQERCPAMYHLREVVPITWAGTKDEAAVTLCLGERD